jgi:hypothetical protein
MADVLARLMRNCDTRLASDAPDLVGMAGGDDTSEQPSERLG